MKNILFFAAVIFCLYLSCTKNSGDIPPPLLAIHYIDSAGNDLFTDTNAGYFQDSVRIYDFENGKESLIYTPNAEFPYGYSFDYAGSESLLQVFGNEDVVNRYTNSIIHLKVGVDDTLKIHLTGTSLANSRYDSVWYNSHLENLDTLLTIVK